MLYCTVGDHLGTTSLVLGIDGQGNTYKVTESRHYPYGDENEAMRELKIFKRQFNAAIHDIKGQVEGNRNMAFDLDTGDVYNQRSSEWVGNLKDY